jgi:hypothetical protein
MPPRQPPRGGPRTPARRPLPPLQFSHPLPYGAVLHEGLGRQQHGVQFVVYSRSATAMRVLLYDGVAAAEPAEVIELDPNKDRWGDIWSVFVPGLEPGPASSASGPTACCGPPSASSSTTRSTGRATGTSAAASPTR